MNLTFEVNGPDFKLPLDIKNLLQVWGTKRYKVTMTPMYGDRTKKQNAYFHLLIGRIAVASGADPEYVKEAVKVYSLTIGYPPAVDINGKEILSSSGEFVPKPSHSANSREMGILINAALYFASENGLEIDPGEFFSEE